MKKGFILLMALIASLMNVNAENREVRIQTGQTETLADTLDRPMSYIIGVSSNPTTGGTTTGAGTYNNGETCILVASPNQGYSFANWTEDGNLQTSSPVYSFTVTENRNLVANFVASTFIISAYADPYVGGSVVGAGNYGYMETCTLTATANPGYVFLCWREGDANVSNLPTYEFTVTANRNLVAMFVPQTYVISAMVTPTNAGSVSGAGEYTYQQTCTLTATEETGYDFVCWRENGQPVWNYPTYTFTVTSSRNLEAYFVPEGYVISATINPTESGSVSGTGTYDFNETCTLTATPNEGYVFLNWTENGSSVYSEPTYSFTVTGNRNLVANFMLASYEISASVNPTIGGQITGSGTYSHGSTCTLIASENVGYTFLNWSENGTEVSTESVYIFTVTANRNLVANFEGMSFQVSVSANPDYAGTVDGGDTYSYGQTCVVTAEANYGYTFANWTDNGTVVSTDASYEFTVTSDCNLVANFTTNTYNIQVTQDPEDGGEIIGTGGYGYGDTCELEAVPALCYEFVGWMENDVVLSTEPNYSFVVEGDRTIVASFALLHYDLEIAYDTLMGTCFGDGNYQCGDSCTITAIPQEHYHFVHWLLDDEVFSTEDVYTFEITHDYSLVAVFEKNSYFVDVIVNPEGAGEVEGMGEYEYGDTVVLCITANENYYFQGWIVNDSVVSVDSCYVFVMEGPVSVIASFEYDDAVSESLSSMIALYPNPAHDAIQIEGADINRVSVFNIYGQLMETVEVRNQTVVNIEVSHYASGTYVVMLDTDQGTAVKRFVKQ